MPCSTQLHSYGEHPYTQSDEIQLQDGVVDTREIAGARGLVLLGVQRKRVQIDAAAGGDAGVVLVRLHQVEVAAQAGG